MNTLAYQIHVAACSKYFRSSAKGHREYASGNNALQRSASVDFLQVQSVRSYNDKAWAKSTNCLALVLMRVSVLFTCAWMACRDQLLYAFDAVVHVDVLDSHDTANLQLLGRPDLGLTFTKLQCWRLTQYSKCVFMDADTLVSYQFTYLLTYFS